MIKIGLFVPLHITAIQDIYMANMQSRFFAYAKKMLKKKPIDIHSIMTIDEDQTKHFDDIYINSGTDFLIDMRKDKNYGIVVPTFKSIEKAVSENCSIFIRLTQDTQIVDFDKFINTIEKLQSNSRFICGRKDTCSDIKNYLKEIDIEQENPKYDFVQGNLIIADIYSWVEHYKKLPPSVRHYCDDSIFSYLCEYNGKIKPTFIEKDFWEENRTKDVYYLESLYKNA